MQLFPGLKKAIPVVLAGTALVLPLSACNGSKTILVPGNGSSSGHSSAASGVGKLEAFPSTMSNSEIGDAVLDELSNVKNHGEQTKVLLQVKCTLEKRYNIEVPMLYAENSVNDSPLYPDGYVSDETAIGKITDEAYTSLSLRLIQNGGMNDSYSQKVEKIYDSYAQNDITACDTLDQVNALS